MATEKKDAANIGIIILAAGESSRLGRPKQLLLYKNKTLLQHTIQTALASSLHPLLVVLGAEAGKVQDKINGSNVHVIVNAGWQEGMASSIRSGVKAFTEISPAAEGVLLMVCDQPFVTTHLLNQLILTHQKNGKPVVACGYGNTFGPPVFFQHSFFAELLLLKGDIGARAVLRQHAEAVEVIPFPEGRFDVDTEENYEQLKSFDSQ